jgi:hypothetical protein
MAATPPPISSSAPTTSHSTRFSLDDSVWARPLAAKAAAGMTGMATSWKTGEAAPQPDSEHDSLQSVNQRTGRPIPHRRAKPRHRAPRVRLYLVSGEEAELWTGERLEQREVAHVGDDLDVPAGAHRCIWTKGVGGR